MTGAELVRRLRALLDECEEDKDGRVVLATHATMADVRILQMELDVVVRPHPLNRSAPDGRVNTRLPGRYP